MTNYPDVYIDEINELYAVNTEIHKLKQRKEEIEKHLKDIFTHSNKTSKTFHVGDFEIKVPSRYYWKLDKCAYQEYKDFIPQGMSNPVIEKQEIKYKVNEEIVAKISEHGTKEAKDFLGAFLTLNERDTSLSVMKTRG